MLSVHIALAVNGHLDVNMFDRELVRERPLCGGQTDGKNARVSEETTIKAIDRLAEVTFKAVSTVLLKFIQRIGIRFLLICM